MASGVEFNVLGVDVETNSPSCGALLLSWMLVAISVLLMAKYGNVGWLMSLLPCGIGMRIRNARDRATMERMRETGVWQKWALAYFVMILLLVGVLVARGVRIDHASLPVLFVMIAFPLIVLLVFEDIKLCSHRRSGYP